MTSDQAEALSEPDELDVLQAEFGHRPSTRLAARAVSDYHAFLDRVMRYLTAEAGISQFLSIGTGLPAQGNVHETARAVNPAARIAYACDDAVVVAHVRAMLAGTPGVVAVEGDVRYPRHLLTARAVRELIDFTQPAAILLLAVLRAADDVDSASSAVRVITDRLAPGSCLVISQVTGDQAATAPQAREPGDGALVPAAARARAEADRFFDGLDLIPPGVVDAAAWRPGPVRGAPGRPALFWVGVGRKPLPGQGRR
ncbi:MAG TPA: SAM-dependent methyltransferase [Streptosporangiaceae bacterium]|nr:SAM-dependent methyltransferase [Streptosporangiaceae bacterium]